MSRYENKEKCVRCGNKWERHILADTFWGAVVSKTTQQHTTQVLGNSYNADRQRMLTTDETYKLCADCWFLFTADFINGKAIPAAARGEGESNG